MSRLPTPKVCPVCGGKLKRWYQQVTIMGRWCRGERARTTMRRAFKVCASCDVRVVLHRHSRRRI